MFRSLLSAICVAITGAALTGCEAGSDTAPADAPALIITVAAPQVDGHLGLAELRAVYAGPSSAWPQPTLAAGAEFQELAAVQIPEKVGPGSAPAEDAPSMGLAAHLGERLFFDPILSASGEISCATCHAPDTVFAQHTRRSLGHDGREGTRNAPTILGAARTPPYFWDGRAASLEEQALGPILNPAEMAASREGVEQRLNDDPGWAEDFERIFGAERVTLEQVGAALSAYERTLHRETRLDRFLAGDDDALNDEEVLGLHLFRTKARCASCHSGPELSDGAAHNIGLAYYGRRYEDLGVYAESGRPEDVGSFNTPSLRHVSQTAPYMHNGLFPHLRGVVNYYNAGGAHPRRKDEQADDPLFPQTSDMLQPLELTTDEKAALVAFLAAL